MSTLIDKSAQFLYGALKKPPPSVDDSVRFRDTGVECWRCTGKLEAYYCESATLAVRCAKGCPGVFLVRGVSPKAAAEVIAGTHVGEIPGGGIPGMY